MNALELLQQDHKTVKELLRTAKETDDPKKQRQLFRDIRTELETHARLEETIFYPAMAEHEELKEMVLESIEEHKQVKTLLRDMGRLTSSKTSNEKFKAKLKVLNDNVEHHAEEEEEGKMFPQVRKLVDRAELEQLGEELENAKNKRSRKAS
jgi:hemerythrin superfamily protein